MTSSLWAWVYDLFYRGRPPWEMGGPRPEVVQLVERGQLRPSSAIDLGCGTGDSVIYLARRGFSAVGVDISARAISQAQAKALSAGVPARFVAGDVTDLRGVGGPFDLVLDFGCLGCVIGMPARERYVQSLLRLTRTGSIYILLNFTRHPATPFSFVPNALKPGEVERLLGGHFRVEAYNGAQERGPLGLRVEFREMRRT